jgi:hypothetical protein
VIGSNGHWCISLSNGNIGHDPTTDAGVHWADQLPPSVDSKTSLLWADVWVAPSGDITGATDSAAFAAPHSACAVGGKIHLKNGIYYTNAAWVISKALNVEGQSFHASPGSITSGGGANGPTLPSQLTGVVITQVTAATDILQLTGSGVHNDLENLGPTFGASILNTNTGHGVNSSPTALYPAGSGPGHETGQWGSQWRNVLILGHDGNHYGFVRNNTILSATTTAEALAVVASSRSLPRGTRSTATSLAPTRMRWSTTPSLRTGTPRSRHPPRARRSEPPDVPSPAMQYHGRGCDARHAMHMERPGGRD